MLLILQLINKLCILFTFNHENLDEDNKLALHPLILSNTSNLFIRVEEQKEGQLEIKNSFLTFLSTNLPKFEKL